MKKSYCLHYKITFLDGSEYSDSDLLNIEKNEIEKYVKLCRAGNTGLDIDQIEYISFYDDEGNTY